MARHQEKGTIEFRDKGNTGYVLDERRRAALAQVDSAKFSYVPNWSLLNKWLTTFSVGSMPKSGIGFFTDACVLIKHMVHLRAGQQATATISFLLTLPHR